MTLKKKAVHGNGFEFELTEFELLGFYSNKKCHQQMLCFIRLTLSCLPYFQEAAWFVADECIQILGGMGYMKVRT